jgi:peptide methionine sulfoxide reductase msrA/msrB
MYIALGIIVVGLIVVFITRISPEAPLAEITRDSTHDIATFAGGCFWCIEAPLQETDGVIEAVSGYTGGKESTAKYSLVSNGTTRHREAVQVIFNPEIVSYQELVRIFFARIDPIDEGGQFTDRGYQYTTAVYYHSSEQQQIIEDIVGELNDSGKFDAKIVTKLLPSKPFYPAEEYHQDYYLKSTDAYKEYERGSGRADYIEEIALENEIETKAPSVIPRGDYDYTDEEIAKLLENLDPLAYHVIAEEGTEEPFNNSYWDNKADGIYVDTVTKEPLFSSTHKYDSGTGWPTFWRTIEDDSVTLHEDNSLSVTRTEIRSGTGHVGHVFDDGPVTEGGMRFCTNSASLLFIPKEDMVDEGYENYLYLFSEDDIE